MASSIIKQKIRPLFTSATNNYVIPITDNSLIMLLEVANLYSASSDSLSLYLIKILAGDETLVYKQLGDGQNFISSMTYDETNHTLNATMVTSWLRCLLIDRMQ